MPGHCFSPGSEHNHWAILSQESDRHTLQWSSVTSQALRAERPTQRSRRTAPVITATEHAFQTKVLVVPPV